MIIAKCYCLPSPDSVPFKSNNTIPSLTLTASGLFTFSLTHSPLLSFSLSTIGPYKLSKLITSDTDFSVFQYINMTYLKDTFIIGYSIVHLTANNNNDEDEHENDNDDNDNDDRDDHDDDNDNHKGQQMISA